MTTRKFQVPDEAVAQFLVDELAKFRIIRSTTNVLAYMRTAPFFSDREIKRAMEYTGQNPKKTKEILEMKFKPTYLDTIRRLTTKKKVKRVSRVKERENNSLSR